MELRHLRYFLAVAEERHITRAAHRLGMQQPPLSLQIKALETELGADLFIRTARGVELTAAGTVFLRDATAILADVDRAATAALQAARGQSGKLSIGFTTSAMLHPIVADLLRAYHESHPQVELDVREGNAAELLEALTSGRVQAALLRIPPSRPPAIAFIKMADERLLAVLPKGHALLAGRAGLLLAQMAQERFILVRRPGAPGIYANVLQACRKAGFEPIVGAEVGHMLTNINLVAAGLGVSLVPASMRGISARQVEYVAIADRPVVPELLAPLVLGFREGGRDPLVDALAGLAHTLARRGKIVSRPTAQS